MCVAWRPRLVLPAFAVLVFVVCDAQVENEAQVEKYVFPRGNHWAVGHLMGKKSIEEPQGSYEQDDGGELFLTAADAEKHTQSSGFLQVLLTALAGPEIGRERERDIKLREQRIVEQRKLLKDQLERDREKATLLLLLALNMKDPSTS